MRRWRHDIEWNLRVVGVFLRGFGDNYCLTWNRRAFGRMSKFGCLKGKQQKIVSKTGETDIESRKTSINKWITAGEVIKTFS